MSEPQVDMKQEKGGDLVNIALQQLMERNVLEVFGERDSERRKS
jgi:hypothetical protein